jgi:SAM-dependent methyltransferase
MVEMGRIDPGSRVLDVASGAGDPSLEMAEHVGPDGAVRATDLSANILAYAAREAQQRGLTNYRTQVVDGEHLNVEPGSFDVVMSRVGLIYFPDQQRALTGMRRALIPGGRTVHAVYSTVDRNGFFFVPISIIQKHVQLPPPLPGQPGPFSLGGEGVLADALMRAGFGDVQTRVVPAPLHMASAADCLRFEQESFGALHQMLAGLSDADRTSVWAEIEEALTQFQGPDGFEAPGELIVGAGFKREVD